MNQLTKPMPSKTWPSTKLLEIPVDCPSKQALLDWLYSQAQTADNTCQLVTMNAEMAYAASENPDFLKILQQADVIIPDGIGVVWALKRQGIQVDRLPGVELVESLFKQSPQRGLRLGILGSSPETLKAFKATLSPEVQQQLVYCQDGYFKPEQQAEILAAIQTAKPEILFVALGVPRQEAWIAQQRQHLAIPVMMGVGGSFDVLSGRLQRAPLWMRKAHLEWLYRLYQQPSRWRRMLALPQFVLKVLRT